MSGPYNQEEALKNLMKEFENELDQQEIIIPSAGVCEEELPPHDEYDEMFNLEPTSIEESVDKVLQETPEITFQEILERFPPLARQKVEEYFKELKALSG